MDKNLLIVRNVFCTFFSIFIMIFEIILGILLCGDSTRQRLTQRLLKVLGMFFHSKLVLPSLQTSKTRELPTRSEVTRSLFSLSTDGWLMSLRSAFIVILVGHLYWNFASADTFHSHSKESRSVELYRSFCNLAREYYTLRREIRDRIHARVCVCLVHFRSLTLIYSAWRKRQNQSGALKFLYANVSLGRFILATLPTSLKSTLIRLSVSRLNKL